MEQGRNNWNRIRSSEKILPTGGIHFPPPQAIDLEETVLGMALTEQAGARSAIEKLIPDDFFKEEHRLIFEAMQILAKEGNHINMASLAVVMRKNSTIDLAGGAYYLAQLASNVASAADIDYYCYVLKEMTIKRKLILLGGALSHKGYLPEQDAFELLNELRAGILEIENGVSGLKKEIRFKEGLHKLAIQLAERDKQEKLAITGVASGYEAIDRITQGFRNGDVTIIAGRPGMAKSSLALCIGMFAAGKMKIPVGFFSLEMSAEQLVSKVVSVETEIDLRIIRGEKLTQLEWGQFNSKLSSMENMPLFIDDTPGLSILDLRARCRRFKDQHKIGLIIIDYLQLMRGERSARGNREEEIASISRALKHIAKELDVPVIALSQLSREVEKRGGNKKPQLSDLRESGSIEQDADLVGFIWRPEYYKIQVDEDGMPYPPGFTEVNFAKHRNGAPGRANLQFIGKLTGFRSLNNQSTMITSAIAANQEGAGTAYPDTSDDLPF